MRATRLLPSLSFVNVVSASPLPEPRVVTSDYHGIKVDDPYRDFERMSGEPWPWAVFCTITPGTRPSASGTVGAWSGSNTVDPMTLVV